jgi:hypothetical protein
MPFGPHDPIKWTTMTSDTNGQCTFSFQAASTIVTDCCWRPAGFPLPGHALPPLASQATQSHRQTERDRKAKKKSRRAEQREGNRAAVAASCLACETRLNTIDLQQLAIPNFPLARPQAEGGSEASHHPLPGARDKPLDQGPPSFYYLAAHPPHPPPHSQRIFFVPQIASFLFLAIDFAGETNRGS